VTRSFVLAVISLLSLTTTFAQQTDNGTVSLTPTGRSGAYTGFTLKSGDTEIATVNFGSNHALTATTLKATTSVLRFTGLSCTPTPALGPASFIEVQLLPKDPFPVVTFELDLRSFDQAAWEKRWGQVLFHFLTCSLPGAEVFHQRGWSIGTPVVDDYIQMKAAPRGQTVVSRWSRDWMYAPPIGAYPMAVAGLWNSSEKRYVGYDFHGARLTDHSEKNFGTTYCWQFGGDREFFCLTWPYGKQYINLRYPTTPVRCGTHFRLLWSRDMGPDDDPNRMVNEFLWKTYADRLPDAERMNDLSWLPESLRPRDFPVPGSLGNFAVQNTGADGDRWWQPNVNLIGGQGYFNNIDYYFDTKDQASITRLGSECRKIVSLGKWLEVGGEKGFFWQTPLDGGGAEFFGPGVETFHHVRGWSAGLALLEYYRNDPAGAADLLPYIDGVLRYTKHILYTRNCYPDVPAAQFAWSATPCVTFCLKYYYFFRNDPSHRDLAELAHKLARNMTYRYLALWPCDNDDMDDLDSSFFMEPNAGLPWLGCACANEIWVYNIAMLYEYVSTGDPIMGHYLRGMLERYPQMFQDQWYPSVREYPSSAFTERYGLFDECAQGKGKRADYGGLWGGFERLIWPVGSSRARVVCGEKAAMAFDRDGRHTDISGYRYYGDGRCSFRLVAGGLKADPAATFDLSVTFPFFDLRSKQVSVIRDGQTTRLAQDRLTTFAAEKSTVILKGVKLGDTVCLGGYDAAVVPLSCAVAKPRVQDPEGPSFLERDGFQMLNLARGAFEGIDRNWDDPKSMAGYEPGFKTLYGVPFQLLDPDLTQNQVTVPRRGIAFGENPQYLFLLVGGLDDRSHLTLYRDEQTRESIPLAGAVPVIQSWPPVFDWHLDLAVIENKGKPIMSLAPVGCQIFALTSTDLQAAKLSETLAALQSRGELELAREATLKELKSLAPLLEAVSGHVAVLPHPDATNPRANLVVKMLQEAGLARHLTFLTAQDLVNPRVFNAHSVWIALYLGGEHYYQTVNRTGDGDEAMLNWLKGGGTLVALSSQPFPFYYNEAGKPVVSASKFGLPINGSGAGDRMDTLDVAPTRGWEEPPAGVRLSFEVDASQKVFPNLPARFPWLTDVDQRWRPLYNVVGPLNHYLPLITLRDEKGKSYGDAAARIEYNTGDLSGAKVVYVWNGLRQSAQYQRELLIGTLRSVLSNVTPPPLEYSCLRTVTAPVIDGKLEDEIWRQTPATEPFTRLDPDAKDGQDLKTTGRMAWDSQYLYVAWECEDPDVWATYTDHDAYLWEQEAVEVYVDPDGDGANYREIEISPRNVTVDLNISRANLLGQPAEGLLGILWDAGGMKTAVEVQGTLNQREDTDKGWTVEAAIPWSNFVTNGKAVPSLGDAWRIQLFRIDRSNKVAHAQFSAWSPTPVFHRPSCFGRVIFTGNPYHDDFSAYPEGGLPLPTWTILGGDWKVTQGTLVGSNVPAGGFTAPGALVGDGTWTDYRVSLRMQIRNRGSDHRDGAWIGVRSSGPDKCYSVNFGRGVQIHKAAGGTNTGDANPLAKADITLDDRWHDVSITVRGAVITVDLDGRQVLSTTDTGALGLPPLASGGVCLSARRWSGGTGDTVVAFDDVRVEKL
jgi:hypothetical protein